MAWPDPATKEHADESNDDPKLWRVEAVELTDKFNELQAHVSSLMRGFLARTTAAAARGDLDAQQAINALTEEASPAVGDFAGIWDGSAGAYRKVALSNWLKFISGLTELTSIDGANDWLAVLDTSAGIPKKIKPDNLTGVFSEKFISPEQTIASGAFRTIPHGLSGKPEAIETHLVCKTDELGYVAGNEAPINPHAADGSAKGQSIIKGASNIFVRYGADPNVYNLIRHDDGTRQNATNGNWRLVVTAWR